MGVANSFSSRNDKEGKKPEDRKLILYGLLKIFHIFVIDMCYLNCGNPSIIFSILRDYSWDWEQFHKKVDLYLDEYDKHFNNKEDLKITIEEGSKKDTYAIRIELKRPTEEESHEFRRATYMEVPGHLKKWNSERVQMKAENSKPTLKIPVAIPFIFLNSKFLIEIFNYCLYGKKDFDQVLLLRKFLTTQLSGTCLALDPNQFLIIFNQCLKFDLPRLKSDGEPLELDIKFEIDKQEDYAPVLDHDFLNSLKKNEEPIEVSGQESDDEELTSLKNNYEEEIAAAARIEKPVSLNENLSKEEFSPAPRTIELEDEDDENSESQKKFREDFEEQNRKFRAKLEAIREERRKKRMAHEAELKDLRRQQKQRFAALMSCIFLKQRFEEKESDWSSWIENSIRQLILKIVRKIGDFQDFTKNFSNFKKLYKEDPEDVISEIRDLHRAVLTLLYDLENIFNNLAKVDERFESVLFVRVIQKRVCEVSTSLIELLSLLEEMEYADTWFQQLGTKMEEITPSKIPSVSELKRICKNLNEGEYKNLEFPKWENKSHVEIEEVDEEDNGLVVTETVKIEEDEQPVELQDGVPEDDNCKFFEEVDEEDDEQVGTETVKSNGDEHHEKGKDGSSEDDKYEDQVQSLRLNEEVPEEADTAHSDKESRYSKTTYFQNKLETNGSGSFAKPESEDYGPKIFNGPQNDTETTEIWENICHSSKLETSTPGANYIGDEVTRPNEGHYFGLETSTQSSMKTNDEGSGSSAISPPTHSTEIMSDGHEDYNLNQNDWLKNLVETNGADRTALKNNGFSTDPEISKFLKPTETSTQNSFAQPDHAVGTLAEDHEKDNLIIEKNGCFTDQEVSKYMEPISQNEQSTVLPPRCGSVSPNLNDSPKSESGNLRGNETTEDALHFLKGLNQNLPDKPVSSRTRSASRPEIVKNSSVKTKKSSKQEKVQSSGSFPVYTGSELRHRFGSSRTPKY